MPEVRKGQRASGDISDLTDIVVGDETYDIDSNTSNFEAESMAKRDAQQTGIATGVGALIGVLTGGKKVAGIGAMIGAGVLPETKSSLWSNNSSSSIWTMSSRRKVCHVEVAFQPNDFYRVGLSFDASD